MIDHLQTRWNGKCFQQIWVQIVWS